MEVPLPDAKLLEKRLAVLQPMVQLASDVLGVVRTIDPSAADAATAMSFRQCAEFADAVWLLSRHRLSASCASSARSCLETAAQTVFLAREPHPVRVAAYHQAPLVAEIWALRKRQDNPNNGADTIREMGDLLSRMEGELVEHFHTPADRLAREQLLRQKSRPTWYSVQKGPANIHEVLEAINLEELSVFYKDLNFLVHGSPKHAYAGMIIADTWLPPLRSKSGFDFQPVLVATTSLQIVILDVLVQLRPTIPRCWQMLESFIPGHNRRAAAAGLDGLVF